MYFKLMHRAQNASSLSPSEIQDTSRIPRERSIWKIHAMIQHKALIVFGIAITAGLAGMVVDADESITDEVHLRLVDHDELSKEIAKAKGRVVVLDCWSTSCAPCIREFPGLVALHNRYGHGKDVVCMSLSLDYEGIGKPEAVQGRVLEFLKSQKATFTNMLSREDADVMYRKLMLDSVPAVFLYDQTGTLVVQFDDDSAKKTLGRPFTYADIEKAIVPLLMR